jgi:hypothetical protein
MVALLGCSQPSDPAEAAGQAVAEARARYQASDEAGHAWRPARQAVASAEQALEAGELERATAEAARALKLAEAALAQAEAEQTAWVDRFPKPR